MQVQIQAFGIAKDIIHGSSITLTFPGPVTVKQVKDQLTQQFPDFAALASLKVAVNADYAEDTHLLAENDEVVLIPPVSGG